MKVGYIVTLFIDGDKNNSLYEPQIFPRDFSEVLQCTSPAPELVVRIVFGHGDPVDVDVHGAKPVELPVHHGPAHHLTSQHLHVPPLVLCVWKYKRSL